MDDDKLREIDAVRKERIKWYADKRDNAKINNICIGDKVLVKLNRQRKNDPYYNPNAYTVVKRKGNMMVARRFRHYITRNTSFFKKMPEVDDIYDDIGEDHSVQYESDNNEDNSVLRRSSRIQREPGRYPKNDTGVH